MNRKTLYDNAVTAIEEILASLKKLKEHIDYLIEAVESNNIK